MVLSADTNGQGYAGKTSMARAEMMTAGWLTVVSAQLGTWEDLEYFIIIRLTGL